MVCGFSVGLIRPHLCKFSWYKQKGEMLDGGNESFKKNNGGKEGGTNKKECDVKSAA